MAALFVLLLVLVRLAVLVRSTIGRSIASPRSNEPRCGRCGYKAIEIAAQVRAPPPNRMAQSSSQSRSGSPFGPFATGRQTWSARAAGIDWAAAVPVAFGLLAWLGGLWALMRRQGTLPAGDRP